MATSGLSYTNCPLTRASPSWIGTVINDNPSQPWYNLHIYLYIFVDKNFFKSYFSDRITLSNILSRTSCRIYRLALPLLAPETLSSSRFSYTMHNLLYLSEGWHNYDCTNSLVSIVVILHAHAQAAGVHLYVCVYVIVIPWYWGIIIW